MIPAVRSSALFFVISFVFFCTIQMSFHTSFASPKEENYRDTLRTFGKDTVSSEYPGGMNAFRKYMADSVRIPVALLMEGKSSGALMLSYVVDTLGELKDIKIQNSGGKEYDKEVIRVLKASQKWKSGYIKDKKIATTYQLPIRYEYGNAYLTDALILENGTLLNKKASKRRGKDLFAPITRIDPEFAEALFGRHYNYPVILIDNPFINPVDFNKKGFAKTLELLKNADSSKVQFFLGKENVSFEKWKEFLVPEKTAVVNFIPKEFFPNSRETDLGAVILLDHTTVDQLRGVLKKEERDRNNFINSINDYRNNATALPTELLYIDDYIMNTKEMFDSLNPSVIEKVYITKAEEVAGKYQDSRNMGYIQVFTRFNRLNRIEEDRKALKKILDDSTNDPNLDDKYLIYINNSEVVDFNELSKIPENNISRVHILSPDEVKEFFGIGNNMSLIYVLLNLTYLD